MHAWLSFPQRAMSGYVLLMPWASATATASKMPSPPIQITELCFAIVPPTPKWTVARTIAQEPRGLPIARGPLHSLRVSRL
jgi:hypothetical protein